MLFLRKRRFCRLFKNVLFFVNLFLLPLMYSGMGCNLPNQSLAHRIAQKTWNKNNESSGIRRVYIPLLKRSVTLKPRDLSILLGKIRKNHFHPYF